MAVSVPRIKLGSQGLEVSKQGLGCMSMSALYGPPKPETDMIKLIHHAIDSGVTFLDTSDVYGPHTNEILIGKALKGVMREKVQLATKFGITTKDGKMDVCGDPTYVRAACEASLKRLDIDCIDLYYAHRIDTRVPIEVTMGELKKLVEEGKIKYVGLSEASASTIRRAHAVHPLAAVQNEWSLWSRDLEEEIVPTCRELGIGIVPYSPLGRGFFSSGANLMQNLAEGDFRKGMASLPTENSVVCPPKNDENVEELGVVTDYTHVFTTHELFVSRDKLFDWVRERGHEHNMVIVISRSDSGQGKKRPRIFLSCERSGHYRDSKKTRDVEQNDAKKFEKKVSKRESGTKKCGCPFRLRGRQVTIEGEWSLNVECGVHNHPIAQYLEGHSYAGRLSKSEEEYVLDMSHGNTRPKDILFGLQNKFQDNKSTIRTIYNARMKNRVVERDGRSQMQQLMHKLKEHGYFYHHRRCETSNTVKDIFFAHPTSVELLRAFPSVIFMDCTYKTNRYKLPLLEIVGVTSTHMTFCIAVAYMEYEREDNYIWACSVLKSLMDPSSLPNVIITDRELALMNAIETTFPTSRHFLCRWHISRNILANCKKILATKEKWESFNLYCNLLVIADSEQSFYDLIRRLQSEFCEYPAAVQYVMEQWMGPYKERFVSAWTNNVMHFDNTTTNRAESHHAALKRQLASSQGNFETCWEQIHTLLETSHNAICSSLRRAEM